MAVISTSAHPKSLWPGVHAWFGQTYDGYEKEYEQIFEKKTSELAYEEEVESTSFGLGTIKQEGASFSYDTHQQLYVQRFTHATWGLGTWSRWKSWPIISTRTRASSVQRCWPSACIRRRK